VDFVALNASPTAFVVTAVEVMTGRVAALCQQADRQCARDQVEPRHVLASGSLPPGFVDRDQRMPYWDGGLVDNTPLGTAIDAFSTEAEVDRLLVVMNLYPLRARLPHNLAGSKIACMN